MKNAFTLLELIIVIVIMGFLAFIGIDIAKNLYTNYLQARSINNLESQTELTLEQIAKRLAVRVKSSTIGRRASDDKFVATYDSGLNSNYNILEWISYSYESFQGGGWSGFVDLDSPNTLRNSAKNGGTIVTPGSDLDYATKYISDLTNKKATLDNKQVGLFFKRNTKNNIQTDFGYNDSNQADAIAIVKKDGKNKLIIKYSADDIYEQYYLLHTAYAVVPVRANVADTDFDLWLHYNYRPWISGEKYSKTETNKVLLAKNVTRFNFTETSGVIVMKLCIRDAGKSLGKDKAETTVCKTKAVY
ncbi:type II secretion system protein [Campylobacter rectus]|uniref:type II secretion system protein n=1 Tax=Campylobacter rectus TaxID=203 RepID=UPI0023EFEDDE|nr:type II secretion system protein [Campylobacter rectus]